MAALDGKIEIGIEYRPCMVRVPAKTKENRNKDGGKSIKIIKKEQEVKALFHCWNHRSKVIGESLLRGGHPGGQVSATFAIVEFEDGTVKEVDPWDIRFVDRMINQYGFREDMDVGKRED